MKTSGNQMIKKIINTLHILSLYRNWYTIILNRLGLCKIGTLELRNGLRFRVRNSLDRGTITEIFGRRIYTKFHKVEDGDTVIDVGAHIGGFSILAATSAKDVKVYAYEPCKESFDLLVENIKLNNLSGRIIPFQLAIDKDKRRRTFYVYPDNITSSGFSGRKGMHPVRQTMETTTLEESLELTKRCDFLKMNCEGAEWTVIPNTPSRALKKIDYISMEYHSFHGEDPTKLAEFLENNGFNVTLQRIDTTLGIIYADIVVKQTKSTSI